MISTTRKHADENFCKLDLNNYWVNYLIPSVQGSSFDLIFGRPRTEKVNLNTRSIGLRVHGS